MASAATSASSPRKLNLVAQQIRGKKVDRALNELTFSPKRIARDVKKVLQSAIANAENNHDLDVDDLVVSEASVGKNLVMKRFHARARGNVGRHREVLQPDHHRGRGKARRSAEKKDAKAGSQGCEAAAKKTSAKKPAAKKPAAKKSAAAKENA